MTPAPIVTAIINGTATEADVREAAAKTADAWADRAENRRDTEHTCPKGRCCWHDPAPFRATAARHRAAAAAAAAAA